MITISINPQTPAHMAILGQALIAMLAGDYEQPKAEPAAQVTAEATPAKKPRKAEEAPAPIPAAPVTVTPIPAAETVPTETVAASPSDRAYMLEDVRAKLAALSQEGKTAAVKALIAATGFTRLTEIPADKYAEVMAQAEAL